MEDKHIETPAEGMARLQDFLLNRPVAIPDEVHSTLRDLIRPATSPVVACVDAAELIYARREELPGELLELGAQLAMMCATFNFHGFANEGRGLGMAKTIRALPDVASKAPPLPPAPKEPPAPAARFLPQPEGDAVPPQDASLEP